MPAKSAIEYDTAFLVRMDISLSLVLSLVSVHATMLFNESITHPIDVAFEPELIMTPSVVMLKVPDAVLVEPLDSFSVLEYEPSGPIVTVPLIHNGPGDINTLSSHVPAKSANE